MKPWYIVAFAIVSILFVTGLWSNIGNGTLSETNDSGKLHMLPGVDASRNTVGSNSR